MKTTYGARWVLVALATMLALAPVTARQAAATGDTTMYTITDLGTLGGSYSYANAINNQGEVIGGSFNATPDPTNPGATEVRGFLWRQGRMTDLGTLGGPDAYIDFNGNPQGAMAISDRGQVASGATYNAVSDPACRGACVNAVLWSQGALTNLGTLGGVTALGNTYSVGNAINNRGQVVGMSYTTLPDPYNTYFVVGAPQQHAVVWDRGKMTDLGTLPSPRDTYAQALGINDRGQIAGEAGFGDGAGHPFFWSNGVMTDIGTLGGFAGIGGALNNQGQVVGTADTALPDPSNPGGFLAHAFLWTGGQMQDLGNLPDEPNGQANAINSHGQIVGLGCCAGNSLRAVIWQHGQAVDLNTLIPANAGWYLIEAKWINDRGQIVGGGMNPQGQIHAYLLTPTHDHGGGGNATTIAAEEARATAAVATLPAVIRRSLGLHRLH